MNENNSPLEARLMLAAPDSSTGRFMYMPSGTHTITPSCQGKPVTVVVSVEPKSAAAALNAQLAAVQANRAPQKAYFDFNHDKDRASFWPTSFEAGADGVYVVGEFSASGKAAVEGKDYRGFSPLFFTDAEINPAELRAGLANEIKASRTGSSKKPAQIVCNENAGLNFGGLVNEPAFKNISPLWAKDAAGAQNQSSATEQTTMTKEELAALQAKNTELQTQITALQAKAEKNDIEKAQLEAKQSELRAVKSELRTSELEAKETDRKVTAAKTCVKGLIARNVIPAQDAALQAKYEVNATADPEMIPVYDALDNRTALTARHAPGAGGVPVHGISRVSGQSVIKKLAELNAKQCEIKIRGLMTEGQAQEKGALALESSNVYREDFSKNPEVLNLRLRDLMELEAATAADTVGTLYGTLVVQRTLEFFRINYPMFKSIYQDFSDQPAVIGQTIATRIVSKPSVQTYSATLGADGRPAGWSTASAATTTDVIGTLDEYVGVPIVFDAKTIMSTMRRLFDEQAPAMSYALASYFAAKIYALMTAANFNGYAAVSGAKVPVAYATYAKGVQDFARSAFVDLNAIFNPNEVPLHDRFVLLNSAYFAAAGKDPSLVTFWSGQRNPEIITEGELPRMSKFSPIEAPDFPTSANRVGFAGQKNSIIAASRLPQDYTKILPGASYGNAIAVTDAETGMSLMNIQYVNHTGGYAENRMEGVIGAWVGDKRSGLVVTSQ